jgi:hypothetical protein
MAKLSGLAQMRIGIVKIVPGILTEVAKHHQLRSMPRIKVTELPDNRCIDRTVIEHCGKSAQCNHSIVAAPVQECGDKALASVRVVHQVHWIGMVAKHTRYQGAIWQCFHPPTGSEWAD